PGSAPPGRRDRGRDVAPTPPPAPRRPPAAEPLSAAGRPGLPDPEAMPAVLSDRAPRARPPAPVAGALRPPASGGPAPPPCRRRPRRPGGRGLRAAGRPGAPPPGDPPAASR